VSSQWPVFLQVKESISVFVVTSIPPQLKE
jgi:hypothetical protein